jgi:hypothetical protein
MNKNEILTPSAITIYAFGLIAALFYTMGIDPAFSITSQQSYYLGVFVGITTAGILLAISFVAWGITVYILGPNEKKEVD